MRGIKVLTAYQARGWGKGRPQPVSHCICPIFEPCECGREAEVRRKPDVTTGSAGWVVVR